jgi:hypothetical protein
MNATELSEFQRNVDAALYGLKEGLSLEVFRSKLAPLLAHSDFSPYRVLDYFAALESTGKLEIDQSADLIRAIDKELLRRVERRSASGLERLRELGLEEADIRPRPRA